MKQQQEPAQTQKMETIMGLRELIRDWREEADQLDAESKRMLSLPKPRTTHELTAEERFKLKINTELAALHRRHADQLEPHLPRTEPD